MRPELRICRVRGLASAYYDVQDYVRSIFKKSQRLGDREEPASSMISEFEDENTMQFPTINPAYVIPQEGSQILP